MKHILRLLWLKVKHPKAGIFVEPMYNYHPRLSRIKRSWYSKYHRKIFIVLR